MSFSKWHAHGNVYLVTEPCGLTPEAVRRLVGDADGILEVAEDGELTIWNADGSRAEMSGNGTRIAARWLAARTGQSVVRLRVGPREVVARMLDGDEVEQDLGEVLVASPETVDGIELVVVDVGNPHAVVVGDPAEISRLGPLLETHSRFPKGTNVQVARVDGPGEVTARVWERGVGETSASGTSAVAVAAATHGEGDVVVHFPGGDLLVHLERGRASLRGPAAPVDESPHDRSNRRADLPVP
jgi:diaminopimelate epimerase